MDVKDATWIAAIIYLIFSGPLISAETGSLPVPTASIKPSPQPSVVPQGRSSRIPASIDIDDGRSTSELTPTHIHAVTRKIKCLHKPPANALLKEKAPELFSFKIKRPENETIEIGRTQDGVAFSITRGGCVEYGEIYLMEAVGGSHSIEDVSFWTLKMAKLLKDLGTSPRVSLLRDRSSQLEELLDKHRNYQFGTAVQMDEDTVEVDAAEFENDLVRVQVLINTIL